MSWTSFIQFIRFGLVGSSGLVIDWICLKLLLHLLTFPVAVSFAYLISASWNWLFNRLWTFRKTSHDHHKVTAQWGRFLIATIPGFCVNRGITLILHYYVPTISQENLAILFCGALGGMLINFLLTKYCVFSAT